MTPADRRILYQHAKKLAPPHVYLQPIDDARFGLFRDGQSSPKPKAQIAVVHVAAWQKADLLTGERRLRLSVTGRAFLRRYLSADREEQFLAQHKLVGAVDGEGAAAGAVRQTRTSPLQWLKAREQAKGYGLRSVDFAAGEALARDYDRAAFHPKQTMNWQGMVFVDACGSGLPDVSAHVLDARRKLQAALDFTGPGLAEVAVAVCCSEIGLEACERDLALPKRSGKLMLKMALTRLSIFYGLQTASSAAASLRMR